MKTVDMHCDTISELYRKRREGSKESLAVNKGHLDLERLKKGDALLQNFALFVDKEKCEDTFEEAIRMADLYEEELALNREAIAPVYCYEDIEKNQMEGKISALLTVEEGGVCKGEISLLRKLYDRGVRMMTLTWNYPNEIGFPALNALDYKNDVEKVLSEPLETIRLPFYKKADREHGLTSKGKEIIEAMEQMGMIVDVSHLSDAGFYDVLAIAKKPFVASHSNARSICPWVRNLTDDMIRKLAEHGGVVGLNFCPDFLTDVSSGEKNPGTIAAIVEHAKHIIRVGGVDCIGLGSDFDGIGGHAELPDYSYLPQLAEALEKQGIDGNTIEKIFYKNVLNFYREVL